MANWLRSAGSTDRSDRSLTAGSGIAQIQWLWMLAHFRASRHQLDGQLDRRNLAY